MVIDELLKKARISRYRLSKISGISQTTIADICSGKTSMRKCSVETLYKIAKALDVTIEELLEANDREESEHKEYRSSFEIFKSNVCHMVKDMGDLNFIIDTLENDRIRVLYKKKWYPETLYLLAMIDYLSRVNDIPICTNYNDIRRLKLAKTLYPSGILLEAAITNNEEIKIEARKNAIPEFIRFNIVESEVRNLA